MNKIKLYGIALFGVIALVAPVRSAMAYCAYSYLPECAYETVSTSAENCGGANDLIHGGSIAATSCTSCTNGATLTENCMQTLNTNTGQDCKITYYTCECSGCSNCESSKYVSNTSGHYHGTIYQSCNCNTCEVDSETYVCDDGYQATSWNDDIPTCTAAPTCGNLCGDYLSTYDSGSQNCCIDVSGSDTKGSYTIHHCE